MTSREPSASPRLCVNLAPFQTGAKNERVGKGRIGHLARQGGAPERKPWIWVTMRALRGAGLGEALKFMTTTGEKKIERVRGWTQPGVARIGEISGTPLCVRLAQLRFPCKAAILLCRSTWTPCDVAIEI